MRNLNENIERIPYPMTTAKETLAGIEPGSRWFTCLDMASGYWQIPLDEESQPLTAFISQFCRYIYMRATMGLIINGDVFNARRDAALQGSQHFVKIVDDILIFGKTKRECMERRVKVMDACRVAGITLGRKKCQVALESVKFAGAVVDKDRTSPDPDLLAALKEFPTPKNRTDLKLFTGLCEQLGRYTKNKAGLLEPLRPYASGMGPVPAGFWNRAAQTAFEAARNEMTNTRKLAAYDGSKPLELHTDASKVNGFGFILFQVAEDGSRKILEAGSRCLSNPETRYAIVELEMAILCGP